MTEHPFARPRRHICVVCGLPCVGRECRTCYHIKNNKIAGRYKSHMQRAVDEVLASIISNTGTSASNK
jgi:hypothetical protein